jgi:predicted nucleic acid-binding protein
MTSRERRFVLDTNIIVSAAFFPKGLPLPCQAMDWVAQQGKILTSESAFAELAAVLLRSVFGPGD